MHLRRADLLLLALLGLVRSAGLALAAGETPAAKPASAPAREPVAMSLEQCLSTALERNQTRPASRLAVAVAEAQHRQALSAYWPQVSLQGAYELIDEPRNFVFPSSTFAVPPMTFAVPGGSFQTPPSSITIPANAFGPGFPPVDVRLPVPPQAIAVPGQTYTLPAQQVTIPDQDVKLWDDQSWYATLEAQWLLWDGGRRSGLAEQAAAGVDAARAGLRRSELTIVDSVTRLFHAAVLARQLHRVGAETLERMEATLQLTEALYRESAGRVTKADYLENRVMVETLRAAVARLRWNQELAEAALAYTIGLAWHESVRPTDDEVPFEPLATDLPALVADAYQFNPDWQSLEAGLRAREGALREAKGGHFPRVALAGDLHRWWNDYDKGMATEENKRGWAVRIGLELPLFQGFRTRGKVAEARARLEQLRHEQLLLRQGLGLQVREVVLGLEAAERGHAATLAAMTAAIENRELNTRAYQNDLVETEEVIKSQLIEAFMSAQHYKTRYDHAALRSRLGLVIGAEVERRLGGE